MHLRTGAALGGALLALAGASVAQAKPIAEQSADRLASFRLVSVKLASTTVQAGNTLRVSGRVQNRRGRRAGTARATYTLRTSRTAKRGQRLGGDNISITKAGRFNSFRETLRVPRRVRPGTYYFTTCVRRGSGALIGECKRIRITVTAIPGPPAPVTPAPPVDNRSVSQKLRDALTPESLVRHLREFQAIADANGGNRASGFQGYGASVQYVVSELRAAGYTPTTQTFDFVLFSELAPAQLQRTAPTATTYTVGTDFDTMEYSGSGDVTAPVTPVDVVLAPPRAPVTSGCEDSDFAGFTRGNIALIQRGTCTFGEKAINAQEAGASAVIIFNQGNAPGRTELLTGTLGGPLEIPVVGTTFARGEELAAGGTTVRVRTVTSNDARTSTNVLADTPGGNADRVVVVGSHLDSVAEGPGINDNGSGSSFNLELAIQMAKQGITPTNKVRFAFWGAEESGLIGSTRYVASLSEADLGRVAANINVDMMASPNHARFVYDGDFSDTPPPATAPDVNPGSARIEQLFKDWFSSQGLYTEPSAFDGRSDYKAFQDAGIPAGGLFSGAEGIKTADQALPTKFGGTAGLAYDPNYHQAGDTIANIDVTGFKQLADGGAHVVALLATDPALRNAGGGARAVRSSGAEDGSMRSADAEWLGNHLIR
jgi:Zn-dependent M28 family amino/carboxypeptidase